MMDPLAGVPETIGRYQVRGYLGRGGMGRVVLGHDPILHRDVALKLVELATGDDQALHEARFLFHREARATAALRHPGIVEVFDYSGPEAELVFIAYEKLDGPTLRAVLDRRQRLTPSETAALGYELAVALDHAHSADIIHRDIKPENIFWQPSGRMVLSDFGIAKRLTVSLGNTVQMGETRLFGSPAYMAPEQIEGQPASPKSDLHALGAVLYEALVGEPVFAGDSLEAILEAVLAPNRPELRSTSAGPPVLLDCIDRLLARDPDRRPTSARELVRQFREALDALEATDPRTVLRDGSEPTARFELDEAEIPTELFAGDQSLAITAKTPTAVTASARLSSLITRGPVMLGMLAVALFLGAGTYLFTHLAELPERGELFDAAVTVTPPGAATVPSASDDVFVYLRFEGEAAVRVDGRAIGAFTDGVRLALPAGSHRLEARFGDHVVTREVMLLADTTPTFDFSDGEQSQGETRADHGNAVRTSPVDAEVEHSP